MSVEYDIYLREHVRNVAKGLDWLRTNLPDILMESENLGVNYDLQFSEHDRSKWDREEYFAYDEYFYGYNKSAKVVQNFSKAWLRHIHHNPHHWQHWVLINDEEAEGVTCIEMPYRYVIEMICDWWSFSWSKGDLTEIFSWWSKHSDYIKFHPKTRRLVTDILEKIHKRLGLPDDELAHHGIKGQKWGVRRTPEELAAARGVASDEKAGIIKTMVSGHDPTPKKSNPNSILDHVGADGKVDKRTYYGSDGMKQIEIHTTNHGHPKHHPYGTHGEHVHEYGWNDDGTRNKYVSRELTDEERKENNDIL